MRNLVLLCFGLAVVPLWSQSWAANTLVSGSYAHECEEQARLSALGYATSGDAVATCTAAITDESLITKDLAATYVNRGVIYLTSEAPVAERDFRMAISLYPGAGDAYVDLGASEIAQGRYGSAISDIDKGLGLPMKQPEKAYFDRALAEDAENNETAAYLDFKKALELRPGWNQPIAELARFTVVTK